MKSAQWAALAAVVVLPGSTAALAAGDFVITPWLDVGSGELAAGESLTAELPLGPMGDLRVVGFELRFDYSEPVADDSFASDAQVVVTGPAGDAWTVGGLTHLDEADQLWSFQGPVSDGPGRYGDSGEDVFLPWIDAPLEEGLFGVALTNDWLGDLDPNRYDEVQIRFYQTLPAPAALAVLAAAALAARRRRRG